MLQGNIPENKKPAGRRRHKRRDLLGLIRAQQLARERREITSQTRELPSRSCNRLQEVYRQNPAPGIGTLAAIGVVTAAVGRRLHKGRLQDQTPGGGHRGTRLHGRRLFVGFTSIVFRPEVLIGEIAGPAADGTPYQVMVVQTDGRVIYDTDPAQIGRMMFEDPLYTDHPDLLDTAQRVVSERYGTATYKFAADGGETVQKEITWTTAGLHGTEWRVAVIRAVE